MKWKIIKKGIAKKLGLHILRGGPECYLEIDLYSIPDGWTVLEFIDFVQKTGIVLKADRKNNQNRR